MDAFRYTLPNGGTVAGAQSIPAKSTSPVGHRPLIICIHGGSYDHSYFDALPGYSASTASVAFGVPVVAIDRPSYGDTSTVLPTRDGSNFVRETASYLHLYILPKLWTEVGTPNQCTCVVLLCHSLGVMGGVAAAAMHAQDKAPAYPLGGVIASGMGHERQPPNSDTNSSSQIIDSEHAKFFVDVKDRIMFRPGTVAPEILAQSERLNVVSPMADITGLFTSWLPVWKEKWAAHVKAPVMFALAELDPYFIATPETVDGCVRAFTSSTRAEGSLVKDAPHCMELSYWSQGWCARCFGFAIECATTYALSGKIGEW